MDRIIRRMPSPSPYCFDADRRSILSASFTGHRPQKLPFGTDEEDPRCRDFKLRLGAFIEMLVLEGFSHFIVGGALGMDLYAAEEVIALRSRYPEIALEVAIPFDDQPRRWAEADRKRYAAVLEAADILTYISHAYTPRCMFARNHYLVANCDLLVAAYDGQPGGTAMTIAMAREQRKRISVIPPVVEPCPRTA